MEEKNVYININTFKKKYYKGLILRGVLFTLLFLLGLFILGGLLEYLFWFGTKTRIVLLILFVVFSLLVMYRTIIIPSLFLWRKSSGITDETAAKKIGDFYKNIDDKLLNFIQLNRSKGNKGLIAASANQHSRNVAHLSFDRAINMKDYVKPAPYILAIFILIAAVSFWRPSLLIESTQRIANFNKSYIPDALFQFSVVNKNLIGYKNENFVLSVSTKGRVIPKDVYLILPNIKVKMKPLEAGLFHYVFVNPQRSSSFFLESTGIKSNKYLLEIHTRPSLKNFSTRIIYPPYTNKQQEIFNGIGNLRVPKGSEIIWHIESISSDSVLLNFKNDLHAIPSQKISNQYFKYNHTVKKSDVYEMVFINEYGINKDPVVYSLEAIEDEFPKINLENYQDTTLFNYIILNGKISDDYGLKKLELKYKTKNDQHYKSRPIAIAKNKKQTYYYKWSIDSLLTQSSNELSYYLQVWDNDGINGSKPTQTSTFNFTLPKSAAFNDMISKNELQAKKEIDNALKQASELEKNIKEAEKNLKGKKNLTWQDENKIKEIIEKKKVVNKAIKQLLEQHKKSNLQKERFTERQKQIKEKAELLQKLMEDLLDEETKKLYEELQKLLEEHKDVNQIQKALSKLDNKEENLEKELERALELFKRMQVEQKIEEIINSLEKISENQEELSKKTENKENSLEQINEQQQEINKSFDNVKKEMDELNELNQELKNSEPIPDSGKDLEDIDQTNEEIEQELKKGKRKKGGKLQKKSSKQIQQLANKIKQMQKSSEKMQENLDHLRDVLHGLIKLSFDQESLMNNFRTIDQSNPEFLNLSQAQIKLKNDSKILEDSLLSLASRVFQISSFVTREVSKMNQYMDESSSAIKERKKQKTVSKQQFAMTSMNNLALLLDDVLQQMQQQMADAMGKSKPQKEKKLGMSELQKQLNDKIKALKKGKGNKKEQQLSEELAKLAREQEQLRKTLQEFQEVPNSGGGKNPVDDIVKKMEETEIDLVNNNITSETIRRQEEILTRMLQSEDALREQEKDEKREGEQANTYDDFVPKAFEKYIKAKKKEIELLKTIPPKLHPNYKNEVSEYFERVIKESKTKLPKKQYLQDFK